MKFLFYFFILCGLSSGTAKTICLNMIVKDESPVIERCLGSVKPFIDYWVIVDTGSKDGTQEKIREFMKDIPGELHESPWVNFAHNRNEALRLAKGKADYVLFLDADERLVFEKGFEKPALDKDYYLVMSDCMGVKYGRIQLINNHLEWFLEGAVHECIGNNDPFERSCDLLAGVNNVISWDGNRSRDPNKYLKDAELLEKELLEKPNHKRTLFYLARSYQDAKMPAKALEAFERRAALEGWDAEVHWSLYQIGILQEWLNMPRETIVNSYQRAYQSLPSRSEPLFRLASYYNRRGEHLMGYLTSRFAMTIEKPQEGMFIEAWIYDFGLLFEFATSAYLLKKYDEARDACLKMLSKPSLPPELRKIVEGNLASLQHQSSANTVAK